MGYAALIDAYQLDGPPPRRLTAIASVARNTTRLHGGIEWLLLPRNSGLRASRAPIEHLGVALKHEGTDLYVLSRLFKQNMHRSSRPMSTPTALAFTPGAPSSFTNG